MARCRFNLRQGADGARFFRGVVIRERPGRGSQPRYPFWGAVAGSLIALMASWATAQTASAGRVPALAAPKSGEVDPRAREFVKRMADYLTGLKGFSVRASSTLDAILVNGQKLQIAGVSELLVRRPDRLSSKHVGDVTDLEFYYDGSSATLFAKERKFFGSVAAPATLDGMLDQIRARLDIEPPAADLLYSDVYAGLMDDTTEGFYVSPAFVGGAKTHHLAFRGKDVDWQIWIEDGDRPLPHKYLITSKWSTGAPEFGVELSNWNLAAQVDDAAFKFTPPPGATKIDFKPAAGAASK